METISIESLSEPDCLATIAKLDSSSVEADVSAAIQALKLACAPSSTTLSPASAANCALLAKMGGLAPLAALLCEELTPLDQRNDVCSILEAMLSVDEPTTMGAVTSQLALLNVHQAVDVNIRRPLCATIQEMNQGSRRNRLRVAGSLNWSGTRQSKLTRAHGCSQDYARALMLTLSSQVDGLRHVVANGSINGLLNALDRDSYFDWEEAKRAGVMTRQLEVAVVVRRLNAIWPLADALKGADGSQQAGRLLTLANIRISQQLRDLVHAALASQRDGHWRTMLVAIAELEKLVQLEDASIAHDLCKQKGLVTELGCMLVDCCKLGYTVAIMPLASILTLLCRANCGMSGSTMRSLLLSTGILEAASSWWVMPDAQPDAYGPRALAVGCDPIKLLLVQPADSTAATSGVAGALGLRFWPAADRYLLVKNHRGHGLLEVSGIIEGGPAAQAIESSSAIDTVRPGCMLTAIGEQSVVGWRAHDTLQLLEARQMQRPLLLTFQAPAAEKSSMTDSTDNLWVVVAPGGAAATESLEVSPAWQDTPARLLPASQTVQICELKSTSWGQQRGKGKPIDPPSELPDSVLDSYSTPMPSNVASLESHAMGTRNERWEVGGWISLVSASGVRLIEPIALHLGNTLIALQHMVRSVAFGPPRSTDLVNEDQNEWKVVAERAGAALAQCISKLSKSSETTQSTDSTAETLTDGYTELLFRLAMLPELQLAIICGGGYEALCARASESLLASAAVAAMSDLYRQEQHTGMGSTSNHLTLDPVQVALLVDVITTALANGQLYVEVDGVENISVADLTAALASLPSNVHGRKILANCGSTVMPMIAAALQWPVAHCFNPDQPPPVDSLHVQAACINILQHFVADGEYLPLVASENRIFQELERLLSAAPTEATRDAAMCCHFGISAFVLGRDYARADLQPRLHEADCDRQKLLTDINKLQAEAARLHSSSAPDADQNKRLHMVEETNAVLEENAKRAEAEMNHLRDQLALARQVAAEANAKITTQNVQIGKMIAAQL